MARGRPFFGGLMSGGWLFGVSSLTPVLFLVTSSCTSMSECPPRNRFILFPDQKYHCTDFFFFPNQEFKTFSRRKISLIPFYLRQFSKKEERQRKGERKQGRKGGKKLPFIEQILWKALSISHIFILLTPPWRFCQFCQWVSEAQKSEAG